MTDDEFLEAAEQAIQFLSDETLSDYRTHPLPDPTDLRVIETCNLFRQFSPLQRQILVSSLGEASCFVLLVFAERMAMLSVRQNSMERLSDGLLALLMRDGNLGPYAMLMVLSLIYRSASKLAIDPRHLFADVIQYSTDQFTSDLILSFLDRSPADQSIVAMGYREFQGPNGLVYWFGKEPIPTGLLSTNAPEVFSN